MMPDPGWEVSKTPSDEEYLNRVNELIGDPNVAATIKNVSKWYINEIVAERYSEGNVYVLHKNFATEQIEENSPLMRSQI